MSIPLVQNNEKDSINTSIIAIKRQIERINMLLGLSNSEEIDTSVFATKDELQQAVTDLQPVDEVTVDNMHSVTSNAVAEAFNSYTYENVTDKIEWNDNILLGSEAFLYKYGRLAHLVIFINVSSTSSEWNVIGRLKTPLCSSILIADTRGVGVCRNNGKGFNLVMSKDSFYLYAVVTGGLSAGYCTAEMTYII